MGPSGECISAFTTVTAARGINLLDTRVFADRDRTADSVVRVARGLWEQWGPRMQSILEQTVKTLHEANEHPDTADCCACMRYARAGSGAAGRRTGDARLVGRSEVVGRQTRGRTLAETRFYTGVPDPAAGPLQLFWHGFWSNKIRYLRSRGIYVYRGRVNARGQEKGVDVSLALDLVRATYDRQYEAAIIVSQDWDFGPAVRLAKETAQAQGRRLVFESCFPVGPGSLSRRGVPGTTWVPIDQATYDACRDSRDYRPRRQ